eukprot:TRINITY_DN47983_c0_g1_i1.p1 TRINITY_DN47983_c0_g1~~TRINITY_DN47983_c0_g1_i1.p1  ORF type:complete len:1461 (-),score=244.99 TRINITY_DN47983_c0_g1_i1:257-4639(-)
MADDSDGPNEDRVINIRTGASETDISVTNGVTTSKYTKLSFLPLNLWEQLHKFGNVYFLIISVIMYLGEKTPLYVGTIKAFSTLGLLVMMMSVTAAMALYDDLQRKRADELINHAKACTVSKSGELQRDTAWQDVAVGDLVMVTKDQEFPADVVPLACSGEGGNCYVSTANLDGETNLKLKTAPTISQELLGRGKECLKKVPQISGTITVEAPNNNIYDFHGSMALANTHCSLGAEQLLMRGTVLRNTDMCLGVVVYTGKETRMIMNSRPAPLKQSNLERITNFAMFIILSAQAVFALGSALMHVNFTPSLKEHWYLYPDKIILPELLGWWLTFFTLYSNLMPISLYPTVEFCNAFQCYFIRNDRHLFYRREGFNDGEGFPAMTRTSSLCQELGQVSYLFSDKTGTLTENDMDLKRLSIAGQKFGSFEGVGHKAGFNGGPALQRARVGPSGKKVEAFLEVLAVAHTVMATQSDDGTLKYEAESPDEYALVDAAAQEGWSFQGRKGKTLTVNVSEPGQTQGKLTQYTVLATNAFNSERKRQSVVVQKGSNYLLLIKGADNVMLERASGQHKQLLADLHEFSAQGLRTLVIGSRSLTQEQVNAWLVKYDQAQCAVTDRDKKLHAVAEEIEKSIEVLGATAIEDKLQEGVPETIENIRTAGIKLWVLTGDKLETARNIGFSTNVLSLDMDIKIVDDELGTMNLDSIMIEWGNIDGPDQKALMVTGKALAIIFSEGEEEEKEKLLTIATSCAVLIACRVSPSQKAELVQWIRAEIHPTPVTLAVGDGANDVPMIQTAQVGIGIAGREGRQAVNNSDFAIGQFRYLERLLFVHGRWNYRRACKFTLFTFWRNMVQVLMIMYYTSMSGYSGTCLYEDWIRLSFNALCTLPILAVGCMDEDVSAEVALKHPQLYQVGRLSQDLNSLKTIFTILIAIVHSMVLFWTTIPAFPGMETSGSGDYYTFGTICYTCLLIDVNYRAFFLANTHNKYTIGSIILSFVLYVVWLIVYPSNPLLVNKLAPNMYMVPFHMVKSVYFWLCIIAVPMLAMTFDVAVHFFFHRAFPDIRDDITVVHADKDDDDSSSSGSHDCADCGALSGYSSFEEDSDGKPYTEKDKMLIALTSFGQLSVVKWQPKWSKAYLSVVCAAVISGTVLLAMGAVSWYMSESYQQVRITYSESKIGTNDIFEQGAIQFPVGTRDDEKLYAKCQDVDDGSQTCWLNFTAPRGLRRPLMYYSIGPFYQNYNSYMKSEVIKELEGKEVAESLRKSTCVEPTRVDAAGAHIVPCGMKATSFFNDTYELLGHKISEEHIAWNSDMQRYANPNDYPDRQNTEWLYQQYPGVIDQADGVRNPRFVDWMRPSAVPRVWNKLGHIEHDFGPGEAMQLKINSRYPMDKIPGGYKTVVLTEYGIFGGRHSFFGIMMMIFGALCYAIAIFAFLADKCLPAPQCSQSNSRDVELVRPFGSWSANTV